MSRFSIKDIIRYSDGEMSKEEKDDFLNELSLDSALRDDLRLYNNVDATLKAQLVNSKEDKEFKANIYSIKRGFFSNKEQNTSNKKLIFSKYWLVAAVLLISLFVWAPWNKNLYEKYADHKMISTVERGENSNEEQKLARATQFFNAKNFKEASIILKDLVEKEPINDMYKYYYGISLVEINDLAVARENLQRVFEGNSIFKYDAAFNIALSYLKEKDELNSKMWLYKIPKDADVYLKAKELSEKL